MICASTVCVLACRCSLDSLYSEVGISSVFINLRAETLWAFSCEAVTNGIVLDSTANAREKCGLESSEGLAGSRVSKIPGTSGRRTL